VAAGRWVVVTTVPPAEVDVIFGEGESDGFDELQAVSAPSIRTSAASAATLARADFRFDPEERPAGLAMLLRSYFTTMFTSRFGT
jgi:hypothetical protein